MITVRTETQCMSTLDKMNDTYAVFGIDSRVIEPQYAIFRQAQGSRAIRAPDVNV